MREEASCFGSDKSQPWKSKHCLLVQVRYLYIRPGSAVSDTDINTHRHKRGVVTSHCFDRGHQPACAWLATARYLSLPLSQIPKDPCRFPASGQRRSQPGWRPQPFQKQLTLIARFGSSMLQNIQQKINIHFAFLVQATIISFISTAIVIMPI